MKSKIIALLLLGISFSSFSQFLDDKKAQEITKKGLDLIYNLQFDKADETLAPIVREFNKHPVHYLLNAVKIEWENPPIDKNSAKLKLYLTELEKCKKSARELYNIPQYRKEALFFLIASHGFIALAHNYQKDFWAAATEGKKANDFYKESKKYKSESAEFMLISGLYNFYIVQYPETHPMIKPVMVFFEKGNKTLGLSEMEIASKHSVFSRVESSNYLSNMYVKYMSNFKKALQYSSELYYKYPNNYIFKIKYIECLLLTKDFQTAEKLNNTLANRKDNVSQLAYYAFDGYIQEYQNHDLNSALLQYARAVKIPMDMRYTAEYQAMANFGMGKIFANKNDDTKAKAFFKHTIEISEYEWLIAAAKAELKKL